MTAGALLVEDSLTSNHPDERLNMKHSFDRPLPAQRDPWFGPAVVARLAAVGLSSILAACGGSGDAGEEPTAGVQAEAQSEASAEPGVEMAAVVAVSSKPVGFGAGVTGGAGGKTVRVKNADDLKNALCNDRRGTDGNLCLDKEPRIIEIEGIIDLTGSEGSPSVDGCYATACADPKARNEVTLLISESERYRCTNKPGFAKYTYSKAGLQGMTVGANKTVVGIGANSGVKGKGFRLWTGANNVIIRNLKITDINAGKVFGGDAITLGEVSRVWIDHNYFSRIARQMIVSGSGSAKETVDDVTISNNEFDGRTDFGCDGRHYWNVLLAGNGQMTLAGNWFHHTTGRAPKLNSGGSGLQVHLVNNFFEDGGTSGHALETGEGVKVLVEGNYFKNMPYPIEQPHGQVYGIYQQTAASQSSCTAALGRICTGNAVTPAPAQNYLKQDSSVLNAMKPYKASIVKAYSASNVPDTVKANAGVGKLGQQSR